MDHRTCSVDGCEKPVKSKGLCNGHNERRRKGKPLHGALKPMGKAPDDRLCTVPGCDHPFLANGICRMHYERIRRHGDLHVLTMRPVGMGTIKDGYLVLTRPDHPLATSGGSVRAHRVALYERIGPGMHQCYWCGMNVWWENTWPIHRDALVVDHLDGDRLNNDPDNLVAACGVCNRDRER